MAIINNLVDNLYVKNQEDLEQKLDDLGISNLYVNYPESFENTENKYPILKNLKIFKNGFETYSSEKINKYYGGFS